MVDPTPIEIKSYKKWQIAVTEQTIYKGSLNYKFVNYGYRFYNGDTQVTSSGIYFLAGEHAFEAGKRKIDELLKSKKLTKPNKNIGDIMGFGGKAGANIKDKKKAEASGETTTTKPKKRAIPESAKSDKKTTGNKPKPKRSQPPVEKKATKPKPKAQPTEAKKPSGKGTDRPKPQPQTIKTNQVNGEKKMSKAMTRATNAVNKQASILTTLGDKYVTTKEQIVEATNARNQIVDRGVALLQSYKSGITAVVIEGSEDPVDVLKVLTTIPKSIQTGTNNINKHVKALGVVLEKIEEGNAKLDDLKLAVKEVEESEKNAD